LTAPRIFTIPPGTGFLHRLGAAFLGNTIPGIHVDPADPFARADATIYLPNRRACRSFAEILVELNGAPLLLPRIKALGDIDPVESVFEAEGEGSDFDDPGADLPPPVNPLQRLLLLTRLVQTWCTSTAPDIMQIDAGEAVQLPGPQSLAVKLAGELARLMDQIETEDIDLAGLGTLVPENHSAFWDITVDFLSILVEAWPAILDDIGCSSIAAHRNRMIRSEAARLGARVSPRPVIAAGSTGTNPATAELLQAIAGLPAGAVILPGLDHGPDADEWQQISITPSHPQYGLAQLLARFDISRDDVVRLEGDVPDTTRARITLAGWAMQPEQATAGWGDEAFARELSKFRDSEAGLTWVEAATAQEEALVIALKIRSVVEDPTKTVALVTPDRTLARRVQAELERWEIVVDDSAGQPLTTTPPGIFASLIVEALGSNLSPVPLLALLKHPLCTLGTDAPAVRRAARILERNILRGPRPDPGLVGLQQALAVAAEQETAKGRKLLSEPDHVAIADLLERLEIALQPWQDLIKGQDGDLSLEGLFRAHRDICIACAAGEADQSPGLFAREAGEALDQLFDQLLAQAPDSWRTSWEDYAGLFKSLAAEVRVRSRTPAHPKIHIWGLLEARMMRVDTMILGGLNEGTWPADVTNDPWLSRNLRAGLGLSPPERWISLAAHDFVQAFAVPDLMLTRAAKIDGETSVPSRWLLRLEAVLMAGRTGEVFVPRHRAEGWLDKARQMDEPGEWKPAARPAHAPPVSARPRKLSVSTIETLIRDPYAIYARYILGLAPLDDLDTVLDARERGNWIHKVLSDVGMIWQGKSVEETMHLLRETAREQLKGVLGAPETKAVILSRFDRVAPWFAARNENLLQDVTRSFMEIDGEIEWASPGGTFILTARADRIDLRQDGKVSIYDYKTGKAPTARQEKSGFSPQLLLEGAIAREGGFESEASLKAPIHNLAYIELSGRQPPGQVAQIAEDDPDGEAARALARLKTLIEKFDETDRPYLSRPSPKFAKEYGDYNHLARVQEWPGGEDGQ
jgi:ATP-dependent helicase/nuclease subunit B